MSSRTFALAWVASTAAILCLAAYRWSRAAPVASASFRLEPLGTQALDVAPVAPLALGAAEDDIVSNDLFRLANAPAAARYAVATDAAPALPARVARVGTATMTLRATAGGPPWQALIEGISGRPGLTLVRVGAVVERLTVRAISRDSVVLRGPDTTWVLTFPRRS